MNSTFNHSTVSVELWQAMLVGGYRNLKRNMSVVDDLNVFPVPDGDTGKNMTMTIEGGVSGTACGFDSIGDLMARFSRASLFAARGNSGVILSQFIRGLALGSEGVTEYTPATFITAFSSGKTYAYQAVATPTEGTMLTLLREGNDYLQSHSFMDFDECLYGLLKQMRVTLQKTPEMLAVLKEAGVVDSGGAGLVCIFEGMLAVLRGEEIPDDVPAVASDFAATNTFDENSELVYGYCTEFILQLLHSKTNVEAFSLNELTQQLQLMGDSVVTVQDGSVIKAHVHTFSPEQVIGYVRGFGELVTVKIENMSVQHSENQAVTPREKQKYAIVATATGEGIGQFFAGVGVDVVIDGGRTNNPSTEDFISAFEQVYADSIVVLPNDSNVILTARQAAELYDKADVRVIETRSLAEGYSALSMMDLAAPTVENLIEDMTFCLPNVTTGSVAPANRDTTFSGLAIHKGEWLGCEGDTVWSADENPLQAAMQLFERLPNMDEKQVVTAFYGQGVTEQEVAEFEERFAEEYPLVEIGFINGGQDVYRYIFAIE
ncbi:MAG: DAK2 domain-containing protein [Clostridia bacterium]|nr:DAK2 domain-containing protein [Clostridia bacterium]